MDTQRQWGQPPGGAGPPGPGWRPPRRRLPAGAIAAGVVLLVVLLAVTSIGSLRWWPSFPNPFGAREVDRSQPVLLKAIEDLEVFKAATGNFQVVVDLEEGSRGIPLVIKGERTLFVAGGSVDAEVDFSGIGEGAIKVSADGERVDVTLPRARLTQARVDPAQSRVFSRERGLLDRLGSVLSDNPTSERELYQLAQAKMQAAAAQSDLRARAEQNTRAMLESMLRSLGYGDVTVTFRDPPS
ncbi:MAG TPA: DUF4230 domain-containing protein [Actinomycetota bacterium]|nr:DUF4230 domain-containing protein [Actinomycetota bacterium]